MAAIPTTLFLACVIPVWLRWHKKAQRRFDQASRSGEAIEVDVRPYRIRLSVKETHREDGSEDDG